MCELSCTLEERTSAKTGKPYKVVVIHLAPNVDKLVFLSQAELALLEMQSY